MQKKTTLKKTLTLLALASFLGVMTGTASAVFSNSDSPIIVASNDDDQAPASEEAEAPYSEEEKLQDDMPVPDDNLPLEDLTEEEMKLYQEMLEKEGQ